MKIKFAIFITIICCITCFGQKEAIDSQIKSQLLVAKKQVLIDDLETQIKDVPFASVRVFVRYKIASWLWKDGKDETERAEQVILKAVDDLFKNKSEIPSAHFNSLQADIFTLLETNLKDKAKSLKEKYKLNAESELDAAHSLLDKKDGEKLVVEKILKFLNGQTETGLEQEEIIFQITLLLDKLQARKSPEINRVLVTTLSLEETGKLSLSADSLISFAQYFRDSTVSNDLQMRFYTIVINKVRNTIRMSDADVDSTNRLINFVLPDISANAPTLLGEASALKAALSSKILKATSDARERENRINESSDKISAIISEAEKTEDESVKYLLYVRAAKLALLQNKFKLAVDLTEKTLEGKSEDISDDFRKLWHDQSLSEIVQAALKKDDINSAEYAVKKINNILSAADSLLAIAVFYSDNQEIGLAVDSYNKALKLTEKADIGSQKFYTLFRLISSIQKIDKSRVSEIAAKIAKDIDDIPTLGIDDKPQTENYKNYVTSIMSINYNLLRIMNELAKDNKDEARNLADRINRKEIKIVANSALMFAEINFEENTEKKKNFSK